MRLLFGLTLAVALSVAPALGASRNEELAAMDWNEQHVGESLDLSKYHLVFSDEFEKADITADGGTGPWYAPIHYPWGVAGLNPPDGKTYFTKDGVLTIRATQDSKGKWHSGSIQTVDSHGMGFARQYGYFEARMKFPAISGVWPAFWLKSQRDVWDHTLPRTEIDIVEWYGGDPRGHHCTVHVWPAAQPRPGDVTEEWGKSDYTGMEGLAGEWHNYGALITPEWVIVYLDRKELARFKTLPEFQTLLYPLVSLELYNKDADKATSPADLLVDYVRVYSP